jgi:hypothetical protein
LLSVEGPLFVEDVLGSEYFSEDFSEDFLSSEHLKIAFPMGWLFGPKNPPGFVTWHSAYTESNIKTDGAITKANVVRAIIVDKAVFLEIMFPILDSCI